MPSKRNAKGWIKFKVGRGALDFGTEKSWFKLRSVMVQVGVSAGRDGLVNGGTLRLQSLYAHSFSHLATSTSRTSKFNSDRTYISSTRGKAAGRQTSKQTVGQ